jgi:HD-GYP domain-containing protein (c-di-GMP phosphodiesterase class II)
LIKPCQPELILQTVNEVLKTATVPVVSAPPDQFSQEHLGLLTGTLAQNVRRLEATNRELAAANLRLDALIELGELLTREHHLANLLEIFCKRVRVLIRADYAAVGILAEDGQSLRHFFLTGSDPAKTARMSVPSPRIGLLDKLLSQAKPLRPRPHDVEPHAAALSPLGTPPQSFLGVRIQSCNQVHGLFYLIDKLGEEDFTPSDEQVVVTLANQLAVAYENACLFAQTEELFQSLQRSNAELSLAYDATLEGWVRALDLRDKETEGHTQRVTEATMHLARAMGLGREELVHIRRGALLHDIGKIGIPDQILLKPGPLSSAEWDIMRRHPLYAYEWLAPIAYLQKALEIPYCHHEKWNGLGYPRGLKDEQIPLAARIFAVVDVWDALSSDRPYRPAWPPEQVRKHVQAEAGSHFDPQIVEVFSSLDQSQWQKTPREQAANRASYAMVTKGRALRAGSVP